MAKRKRRAAPAPTALEQLPTKAVKAAEEIWAEIRTSSLLDSERAIYTIAEQITKLMGGAIGETKAHESETKGLKRRISDLRRIIRSYMGLMPERLCPACGAKPDTVHSRGCKVGAVMSERWTIKTPPKPANTDVDKPEEATAESGPQLPSESEGDGSPCETSKDPQVSNQTTTSSVSEQPGNPEPIASAPTG